VKKTALFSTLFLAVFGLTMGITLMTYQPAAAIVQCSDQCLFRTTCSLDTGPLCAGDLPYYAYRSSTCTGGPHNCPWIINEPIGCWSGTPPCLVERFELP
jgi:hypothetical protein